MKTVRRAAEPQPPTARQGEYLAFIHHFILKNGLSPSFEEIAAHFGTSPPSVNGMIKTLERRGLLSRIPGVARSLRVLAQSALLPDSDFGSRARREARRPEGAVVSPVDIGVAAAIAVLDVVMPAHPAGHRPAELVLEAARAVQAGLTRAGLVQEEARDAARRVTAEAARWQADGRGIVVRRRSWRRR